MVQIFERYLEQQFQATITLQVLPLTPKLHLDIFSALSFQSKTFKMMVLSEEYRSMKFLV